MDQIGLRIHQLLPPHCGLPPILSFLGSTHHRQHRRRLSLFLHLLRIFRRLPLPKPCGSLGITHLPLNIRRCSPLLEQDSIGVHQHTEKQHENGNNAPRTRGADGLRSIELKGLGVHVLDFQTRPGVPFQDHRPQVRIEHQIHTHKAQR